MYHKILVPLALDDAASAVLDHVISLAQRLQAELVPLHVITVVPVEDYFFKQIQVEEGSAAHKAKTVDAARLAEIEENVRLQGITVTGELIISDQPEAEAIVNYAHEAGCDLIVVPNQTHVGISRWLFSSLGEKVRRRSAVPVLFV
jgi:nucleotide-binding universal stress UspA family protein